MDAARGVDPGLEQPSPGGGADPVFAGFMQRARALAINDIAGADALVGDIAASGLHKSMFEMLAQAIAQATGQDSGKLLKQLRDGRQAHQDEAIIEVALAGSPNWKALPPVMSKRVAGALLNLLLGFALKFGAGPSYFMRHQDGSVVPLKSAAIGDLLAPYSVTHIDPDGKEKLIPAAAWWKGWEGRYTVDLVTYDPEKRHQSAGQRIENLWRGFAVEPKKGRWPLMARHIFRVVCGGDRGYFRYLICWMAHAVQYPGTFPGVMVVLRSDEEGVGKSTIAVWLGGIFGRHALKSGDDASVFGEFNGSLLCVSFVPLEEAGFPGDHRYAARVKNVTTNPMIVINEKGQPRFEIPNMLHLMLTTNATWAVPAGNHARRFFVLDVVHPEKDQARRKAYFDALYAEKDNGGLEAMLYDLRRIDLSGFNPRDVPRTDALRRQQEHGLDDMLRWARDWVVGPAFDQITGAPQQASLENHMLHGSYLSWAQAQGIRHPKTLIDFGRRLKLLGFVHVKTTNKVFWTVPNGVALLQATERVGGLR